MYSPTQLSIPKQAEGIFSFFLLLYPIAYRKKFGYEMRLVLAEMYQEEVAKNGNVGLKFWFSQIKDIARSILEQHQNEMKRKGMKKYFQQDLHINTFNVIGFILLLPFLTLLSLDVLGRLVQGDLTHYNRPWYAAITHSILYREPIILQIVLIYGPLLAVVLNVINFVFALKKIKKPTLSKIIFINPLTIVLIGLGLFFLVIVYGHDFVPCMIHGFMRVGIGQLLHIVAVCRNA